MCTFAALFLNSSFQIKPFLDSELIFYLPKSNLQVGVYKNFVVGKTYNKQVIETSLISIMTRVVLANTGTCIRRT